MKIKKIIYLLIPLFLCLILSGCSFSKQEESNEDSNSNVHRKQIVSDDFNDKGTGTLRCKTNAKGPDGVDVLLNYEVIYKRGNILLLHSISKISSNDINILDTYENSYRNISNNYNGLKFYDTHISRNNERVIYDVVINYEKIDIDKLLEIEGEEDNIVSRGKPKLRLWLDLADRFGTTCEEV